MFIDPTGKSKDQGGDPYVKTLNRSVSDFFYIGINRDQLVKKIGESIDPTTNYFYSNTFDSTGGSYDYDNNVVMITNKSFQFYNLNDVKSTIEHELLHKKFGKAETFKDHVDVYFNQAKSGTFKKTSDKYKAAHSVAYGQRLLNSYVKGEIASDDFDNQIAEYNLLNQNFKISRNNAQKPKDDSLKVANINVNIKYKEMDYGD